MLQCEKLFLISVLRYLKAMCSFDFWTELRYCCKQFRDGPYSKNLVLPDSSYIYTRLANGLKIAIFSICFLHTHTFIHCKYFCIHICR